MSLKILLFSKFVENLQNNWLFHIVESLMLMVDTSVKHLLLSQLLKPQLLLKTLLQLIRPWECFKPLALPPRPPPPILQLTRLNGQLICSSNQIHSLRKLTMTLLSKLLLVLLLWLKLKSSPKLLMVLLPLSLLLLLRKLLSGSRNQVLLKVMQKLLLSLVPLMLLLMSTVLSLNLVLEECWIPPTLLIKQLLLLLLQKNQLISNLLLLLLNILSRDLRLRLELLPSLTNLRVLAKARLTNGCVKLPLWAHLTQLSELPWKKVLSKPKLNQQNLKVIRLFGALSLQLSSWLLLYSSTEEIDDIFVSD